MIRLPEIFFQYSAINENNVGIFILSFIQIKNRPKQDGFFGCKILIFLINRHRIQSLP